MNAPTAPSEQLPPPPPTRAPASSQPPPPTRPPTVTTSREPSAPLRERLPELVATIGGLLVAAAVAGFVSSTWADVGPYLKAMVLAAAAAGLTSAALFADGRDRGRLHVLAPIVWAAGTATVAGALVLALGEAMADTHRIAIALAGAGAALHAGVLWRRRPRSVAAQVSVFGSLVFAVGPFSLALDERWTDLGWESLVEAFRPVVGLFDPTLHSDAFLVSGPAYALIGAAWLAAARTLEGRARRTGEVGGSVLLTVAALHLNVLTNPVGAAMALVIVLGVLVYGLASEQPQFVVLGAIGTLVAGVRVLAALFSGEVAATVTVFVAGLAMVTWAFRALQGRPESADGDGVSTTPNG